MGVKSKAEEVESDQDMLADVFGRVLAYKFWQCKSSTLTMTNL